MTASASAAAGIGDARAGWQPALQIRQESAGGSPDHAARLDAFFPWVVLTLGLFLVGWLLKRWRAVPRTMTVLSATEAQNLPDFDDE
jgi:hypothetical protein